MLFEKHPFHWGLISVQYMNHSSLNNCIAYQNYPVTHTAPFYYSDVTMRMAASQITSVSIVCSTGCSGADQRKHQISASLAFVRGIHQWLMNSPQKGSVTWKMFPFDDVIMTWTYPYDYQAFIKYMFTSPWNSASDTGQWFIPKLSNVWEAT